MFSNRQRLGVSILVATAVGIGGALYGVDYYKDQADCDADYRAQVAAVTKIRSGLATQQYDAVNGTLVGLGALLDQPPGTGDIEDYRALFRTFKETTDKITDERRKNPLPEPPEGCGGP